MGSSFIGEIDVCVSTTPVLYIDNIGATNFLFKVGIFNRLMTQHIYLLADVLTKPLSRLRLHDLNIKDVVVDGSLSRGGVLELSLYFMYLYSLCLFY